MRRIVTLAMVVVMSACARGPDARQRARELMDVWRTGEQAVLDTLLADEVVYDDFPNRDRYEGIDGVKGYVGHVHGWASDVGLEVTRVHGDRRSAVAEWVMTGVQDRPIAGRVAVATHRRFKLNGATVVELDERGRIARAADYIDVLTFVRDLGGRVELPGGVVLPPTEAPQSDATDPITSTTRDVAIDAPDTLPAGPVRLRLVNQGPHLHHVQFYRLPDSIGYDDAVARLPAREPLPAWLVPAGGAEGADEVGRSVTVTVPLEPGQYLLLCRFETDGVLHFRRGMTRHLVVAGPQGSGPTALPPADAVVAWSDYSFEITGTLGAGPRMIRVENHGPSEHHLAIARLIRGNGVPEVLAELAGTDPGPTFEVLGGTAGLATGGAMLLETDLTPGRYVLLCLVPVGDTGREHADLA
jgi:steroid delta-isomerase-like uncharacterized protein